MKIAGLEMSGPTEEVLVIPRSTGDITFTARAVLDMSEFENQVPSPKAPARLVAGGRWEENTDSQSYKDSLTRYGELRMGFIVTRSLIPSEIDWDTVDFDKPDTWVNWKNDLKAAHFSDIEIQRVFLLCIQANSLDENKLKEAREAFLLGQAKGRAKSSGQHTEPQNTQSGPPANDSE